MDDKKFENLNNAVKYLMKEQKIQSTKISQIEKKVDSIEKMMKKIKLTLGLTHALRGLKPLRVLLKNMLRALLNLKLKMITYQRRSKESMII